MKALLLLIFAYFYQFVGTPVNDTPRKVYYFCTSRASNWTETKDKVFVLYTEIKETTLSEDQLKPLAKKWGAYVDGNCKNEVRCSSDLNTYASFEQAEKELEKFLQYCKEHPNFEVSKVNPTE
ncbi:MAG: hypothetical protein K2P88_00045 [Chitinophagaceae bacterium]|nr:hypothetical protein [Chitinophagaceae bacterium]